ncbi:MAG: hypothetical protein H7831_10260, partial [Magnetococcus sp. WYHC-3]
LKETDGSLIDSCVLAARKLNLDLGSLLVNSGATFVGSLWKNSSFQHIDRFGEEIRRQLFKQEE